MTSNGTLVGTRWGAVSAVAPQPRGRHAAEIRARTPTAPWGSRRLPARLRADDPRRVLFRSLLRRCEGVPVAFAEGGGGTVAEVVLQTLGFDFWPEALVVETPAGRRRVPAAAVARIDVREPRLHVAPGSGQPLERGRRFREQRRRDEQGLQRLERRHDLVQERVLPGRRRQPPRSKVRGG